MVAHSPHDLPSESAIKKKLLPRSTGFTVWLSNIVKALIPGKMRFLSVSVSRAVAWIRHTWDDSRAACPLTPQS